MTWSPRNRTDDGSSLDGEDKEDNEDGNADDDNISIGKCDVIEFTRHFDNIINYILWYP